MVLPTELCGEKEMYMRGEGYIIENSEIKLLKSGHISFDTYFNGFSYNYILKATVVAKIKFNIKVRGAFRIQTIKSNLVINRKKFEKELENEYIQYGTTIKEEILEEIYTTNDGGIEAIVIEQDISTFIDGGIIFLRFFCESDNGKIYDYQIESCDAPKNNIKIGIAICTYKREKYVVGNSKRILDYLETNPYYKDKLAIFVVDNGNTLDNIPLGKIIKNKNTGGSGGFTRGIVEVCSDKTFTHFLLMDDDISFECEILARTVGILEYAKTPESITIGGAMLMQNKPYFQHEKGAMWNGKYVLSRKYGYDLRILENVLRNDFEEQVDYAAWWYCCMSTKVVERIGLPLPFFIKCDDIEYSLRADNDIIIMNGIGVWHESFASKYASELEYYIKRNELILNAIHRTELGAKFQIKKLWRSVARQIVFHRYQAVEFIFKGYEDFLNGAAYFANLDSENMHTLLRRHATKQYTAKELKAQGYDIENKHFFDMSTDTSNNFKKVITLNGYLIPRVMYPKNEKNSFRLIEMNKNNSPKAMYKADRVVQYNSEAKVGFSTRLNKFKLIKIGLKLTIISMKLLLKFKRKSLEYKALVSKK